MKIWLSLILITIGVVAFIIFFPKIWGEVAYPLNHAELIKKYADQYQLDPNLVAAVIYTESRFNIDSHSGAGAKGLMQIIPSTGASIANKLGEPFDSNKLYDPETNIRYGTWYLRYCLDQFNGNLDMALASYNAGGGKANAHVLYGEPLPRETVGYISKVKSVKKIYDEIYGKWFDQPEVRKPSPFYKAYSNVNEMINSLILGQ